MNIGERAPDFTLPDQDGQPVTLGGLLATGPLVLFFYPKDDTPGCTAEACAFRDAYQDFVDAGATVAGISSDSVTSHKGFAGRHGLPFPVLADPGGTVRRLYRVPRTLGVLPGRVTYVIDRAGIIRHRFVSQLDILGHVREALEVLTRLQAFNDEEGVTA